MSGKLIIFPEIVIKCTWIFTGEVNYCYILDFKRGKVRYNYFRMKEVLEISYKIMYVGSNNYVTYSDLYRFARATDANPSTLKTFFREVVSNFILYWFHISCGDGFWYGDVRSVGRACSDPGIGGNVVELV